MKTILVCFGVWNDDLLVFEHVLINEHINVTPFTEKPRLNSFGSIVFQLSPIPGFKIQLDDLIVTVNSRSCQICVIEIIGTSRSRLDVYGSVKL